MMASSSSSNNPTSLEYLDLAFPKPEKRYTADLRIPIFCFNQSTLHNHLFHSDNLHLNTVVDLCCNSLYNQSIAFKCFDTLADFIEELINSNLSDLFNELQVTPTEQGVKTHRVCEATSTSLKTFSEDLFERINILEEKVHTLCTEQIPSLDSKISQILEHVKKLV